MGDVTFTRDPNKPVGLSAEEVQRLDAMTDEQITAAALSHPDNPPLTESELNVLRGARLVREARRLTDLSQEAFAKAYRFSPGRLRDLEQGRTKMDSAIEAYLTLIRLDPERVRNDLAKAG